MTSVNASQSVTVTVDYEVFTKRSCDLNWRLCLSASTIGEAKKLAEYKKEQGFMVRVFKVRRSISMDKVLDL